MTDKPQVSSQPKQAKEEDDSIKVDLPKAEIKSKHMGNKDIRDLAKRVQTEDRAFDPVAYNQFKMMAADLMRGNAIPRGYETVEQVVMALIAGKEMELSPVESVKSFYFVNGTLNLWGAAVGKQMRRHGWDYSFEDGDDSCKVRAWRGKQDDPERIIEDSFQYSDAEQSGWTESKYGVKPGWKPGANRKRKLRYAALAQLIHTYIPEVLGAAAGVAEVTQDMVIDQPKGKAEIKSLIDKKREVKDTTAKKVETEDEKDSNKTTKEK